MIAACKTVNIHDVIIGIAEDYNAPIGRDGCLLNKEQRRRFVLARAVVWDCGVLALDGAITALGSETERELQEVANSLCYGRTVVTFV